MAQTNFNTSFPNDGLGDKLRDAFLAQEDMNTELYDNKVDKVVGKDLSDNNYDNIDKAKVDALTGDEEQNVQSDWNELDPNSDAFILGKPIFSTSEIIVSAIWTGAGLNFNVSADAFPVNGVSYPATPDVVTLDASDPLLNRIDLIVAIKPVDPLTVGTVGKITGTPASVALVVPPDYDPSIYYIIKQVSVLAAATEPDGALNTQIYNDGTEWAVTLSANATQNTSDPSTGVNCIEATNWTVNDKITFTAPAPLSTGDLDLLTFDIKLKDLQVKKYIVVTIINGTHRLKTLYFRGGENNFDYQNLSYQTVSINKAFLNLTIETFDSIEIAYFANTAGFYFDNFKLYKNSGSETVPNTGIQDAPSDGLKYGRINQLWEVIEEDNNIVASIHDNNLSSIFLVGDSHIAGSAGITFRDYFNKKYLGAFGSASLGFVPFDYAISIDLGISFGKSAGVNYMIEEADFTTGDVHHSVSGHGLFTSGATNENFSYGTDTYFDFIRIYYLQKPSGGTFKYKLTTTSDANAILIDTSGILSVQYCDLYRSLGESGVLSVINITGDCGFFGAWFKTQQQTASVVNLATGGMKLSKLLDLNSSSRVYWYGQFLPACVLLCVGTNDRIDTNADDFNTLLNSYINNIHTGSANTKIIIEEPPQSDDYASTYAASYREKRIQTAINQAADFFDLPKYIGNYSDAVYNNLMNDTVHLNTKGAKIHAKKLLDFLGIGNFGNYKEIPLYESTSLLPPTNYLINIEPYSKLNLTASTTYLAYRLGLINGYIDGFFEITAYIRLASSGRARIKKIQFNAGSAAIVNEFSGLGQVVVSDLYESEISGTIPDATFSVNLVSNKLEISFEPVDNLASINLIGTFQLSESVIGDKILYYNSIIGV